MAYPIMQCENGVKSMIYHFVIMTLKILKIMLCSSNSGALPHKGVGGSASLLTATICWYGERVNAWSSNLHNFKFKS